MQKQEKETQNNDNTKENILKTQHPQTTNRNKQTHNTKHKRSLKKQNSIHQTTLATQNEIKT